MTSALLNPLKRIEATLPTPSLAAPSATISLPSIEALHAEHGRRIFRFVLASVRDHDLAQTLTQDTFVRAWAARDSFRGECAVATWLTRIALNLVRDHTRTNRFRFWRKAAATAVEASDVAAHLPDPASSSEDYLIARQQLTRVWDSVATLSERQRTVFLLRFVEEMELSEIAATTGLPLSTVKTHLYRALAAIRSRHLPATDPVIPAASPAATSKDAR